MARQSTTPVAFNHSTRDAPAKEMPKPRLKPVQADVQAWFVPMSASALLK